MKMKLVAMGFTTNRAKEYQVIEGSQPLPQGRSKPKILGDDPMPKSRPLPANFDLNAHKTILKGQAKPATPADYARFISELKQNKTKNNLG